MPPPKRNAGKAPRAGASKVYGMAPELPAGEILQDSMKKRWRLGKAFASGGFGRLYTATLVDGDKQVYVVKVEPAENGPLFQETHVYQRIAKPDAIENWRREHGVGFLGVPPYVSSGRHLDKDGVSYRFLVMPRYGHDLERVREARGGTLDAPSVFKIAENCVNVFEFLHDQQYTHADLKADNLLLKDTSDRNITDVYLVDYGLARKIGDTSVYKEDKRKAHDGTLIFTSLDAHRGVAPSYRGDIEILAYNVVYWLVGTLPWLHLAEKPEQVAARKEKFFGGVDQELRAMLGGAFVPPLVQFVEYSRFLEYGERPNYNHLRKLLADALRLSGGAVKKSPTKRSRTGTDKKGDEAPAAGAQSSSSTVAKPTANRKRSHDEVTIPEVDLAPAPRRVRAAPKATVAAHKAVVSRTIPGLANMPAEGRASPSSRAPLVIRKPDGSVVRIPNGAAVKHRMSMEASIVNKYLRRKSVVRPPAKGRAEATTPLVAIQASESTTTPKPAKKASKPDAKKKKATIPLASTGVQTSPNLWTTAAAV